MYFTFSELTSRLREINNKFFCDNNSDGLSYNYEEYKGMEQAAINHLLETKEGQVKGAFFRHDLKDLTGIGEIDVAWGKILDSNKHTGYGLAHILDKHGIKAVNMIGEIINNGTIHIASNGKLKIINGKKEVIISQSWKDEKRHIIISSFDKTDGKKGE